MKKNRLMQAFLILSMLVASAFPQIVFAEEPVSKGFIGNTAIGKHDATSYHIDNAAEKGEKRFSFQWKGADWFFATAEQRDLFAENPEKYSPAYNGFCSNALTLGEGLIRTDGSVWHIFGDKLHLFFAERGRQRWISGNYEELKKQADSAWQQQLEIAKSKG